MDDVQRQELNRLVMRSLQDRAFRERLTARDSKGLHPILIVGLDDSLRSMLAKVQDAGESANVVVPYLNGVMVVAVDIMVGSADPMIGLLTPDCTVGVLLERLRQDADDEGAAVFGVPDSPTSARAELVALAS